MCLLFFISLGVISLVKLPFSLLPATGKQGYTLITRYPGVGSEKIETLITRPLEEAVGLVPGITSLVSVSEEGQSRIHLTTSRGVSLRKMASDLRARVDSAVSINHFPREVEKPCLVPLDPDEKPSMILSLEAKGKTLTSQRQAAERDLKPLLQKIPGVSQVYFSGGQEKEITVALSATQLKSHGLTSPDLLQILQEENISLPLGRVGFDTRERQFLFDARLTNLLDLEEFSFKPKQALSVVKLSLLGKVQTSGKPREDYSLEEGSEKLNIYIHSALSANRLSTSSAIQQLCTTWNHHQRSGTLKITYDQAEAIRKALKDLALTLLVSLVTATLFLVLFLPNPKQLLSVLIVLPFSLFPSFFLMWLLGISINVLSLAGLGLGLSLTLDASIVILDFLEREQANTRGQLRALEKAFPPLLASSLTMVFIFLPLLEMKEATSLELRDVALTLLSVLAFSFLSAFLLTPLTYRFLNTKHSQSSALATKSNLIKKYFAHLRLLLENFFSHAVHFFINRKLILNGLLLLLTLGALTFYFFLGKEKLSPTTSKEIFASVELPSGTSLSRSYELGKLAENALKKDLGNYLGKTQTKIETGRVSLVLSLSNLSKAKAEKLVNRLSKQYAHFYEGFIYFSGSASGEEDANEVTLEVTGDDLTEIETIAKKIATRLGSLSEVEEVLLHFKEGRPTLFLVPKRDALSYSGVDTQSLAQALRDSLFGGIATKFIEESREVDLRVQIEHSQISNLSELLSLDIPRSNQKALTLPNLIEVKAGVEKSKIFRKNKKRLVTLSIKNKSSDLEGFLEILEKNLSVIKFPPGVTYAFGDETTAYLKGRQELYLGISLSILLIAMLLASLFQNIKLPLLILTSIPFGIIGVLWAHFIFHLNLSFPVYLGIMMLSGITVNHSLLLVEAILRNLKSKKNPQVPLEKLIDQGLRARIRPILLTAGTALVALLPVIFLPTEGGEWFQALAITLFSGTLVALVISLIFIPIYFRNFLPKASHKDLNHFH